MAEPKEPKPPKDPAELGARLRKKYQKELSEGYRRRIENLESEIYAETTRAADVILGAALGVQRRYGEWEIREKTPLSNQIGQAAMTAVLHALPQFIASIQDVQPKLMKRARALYTRRYEESLNQLIADRAHDDASNAVDRIAAEMRTKLGVESDDE